MSKFSHIWDRKKDGSHKEERSFLRYVIISLGIALLAVCVLPHDNIFFWMKAGNTVRKQEKQMKVYRDQIERMDEELHYLTEDKDSLEKFAREKFQFAEPGEDVFIIKGE